MRTKSLIKQSRKANIKRLVQEGYSIREAIEKINSLEVYSKPIVKTTYPDRHYSITEVFTNVYNTLRSA